LHCVDGERFKGDGQKERCSKYETMMSHIYRYSLTYYWSIEVLGGEGHCFAWHVQVLFF
jgi:hypothetical protein